MKILCSFVLILFASHFLRAEDSTPNWFAEKSINRFHLPKKSIILTFDDGPSAVTEDVLDVLRPYNIKATFFVLGERSLTAKGKSILKKIRDDGHIIANHTFYHEADFPDEASIEKSLKDTHRAILPYLNFHKLYFFRSPYGIWNRWRSEKLNRTNGAFDPFFKKYVGPILWNVGGGMSYRGNYITNAADWKCWKDKIAPRTCALGYFRKTMSNYSKGVGSVVLMHDLTRRSVQLLDHYLHMMTHPNNFVQDFKFQNLHQMGILYQYAGEHFTNSRRARRRSSVGSATF